MRYQYTSPGFRRQYPRPTLSMPSGVKFLILANIVVYILMELSGIKGLIIKTFGLVPAAVWQDFKIWQLFTYLFLHGGLFHIFFNMFVLWMFGKDLETRWGRNEFLRFYFVSGEGAGLITMLFSLNSFIPVVGASGAIYGLLLAYGLMYPNRMVYLYGIIPLKVKFMVAGLACIAFFASLSSQQSSISHLTHLSGMVIGLIYLKTGLNWQSIKLWWMQTQIRGIEKKRSEQSREEIQMKQKVDEILEKLNELGWKGLSEQEEQILNRASKQFYKNRPPN